MLVKKANNTIYKCSSFFKGQFVKKNKSYIFYCLIAIVAIFFVYLLIPNFFNYKKSYVQNIICEKINAKCLIKDKIKYTFFPSPRLKIKKLILEKLNGDNKKLMEVENLAGTNLILASTFWLAQSLLLTCHPKSINNS